MGGWISWGVLPLVAVVVMFDLRLGLSGKPDPISARLVGFSLVALVCAPFLWINRRQVNRTGRVMLGSFSLLLGYALVSSLLTERPFIQKILVPRRYLVVPVIEAGVTMLAAWALALAMPRARRRAMLWWAAWVLLVTSLAEWPGMAVAMDSPRLATGMGGAAVVHQAFLLSGGLFLGSHLAGHRRRASLAGVLLSVALLVATGSRAGLGCLVLAGIIFLLWSFPRGLGRGVGRVLAGAAVALALLVALVPSLQRVLVLGDDMRAMNLRTAWDVFTSSPQNLLLGVGSGHLWPWMAFETGHLKIAWRGKVISGFGEHLTSAHSTFAAVAVELGLVGLALFLVLCAALVLRLRREWQHMGTPQADPWAFCLSVCVVAALAASLLDTYLLKSFGIALWWWLLVAGVLGTTPGPTVAAVGASREADELSSDGPSGR
ncbi:O-antigen ligase family protein [Luteococcus sp. OSA5]|uniref:O-antigen ligase family protein n=1 Tax=Luteococcus sp. OSA5 TaxID=3401630 RepID=UPI003B42CF10